MRAILTFFAVLGLDLGTKAWVEKNLPQREKREIVKNHLYIWHIKNRGLAYHSFDGKRKGILLSTGGLLLYYSVLFWKSLRKGGDHRLAMPLALTLGGGYANFWERLRKGEVTDFLFVPLPMKNPPIFNGADLAILLGAGWLTGCAFRKNKKK